MADLNGGQGKFWGVDGNVQYADSFVGATKVAEKVKKGGTETKSDGYVVDAIDIDWGGLKLTTIAEWRNGLQTVSSTEQNAGKGDNTQGIHSTAYLTFSSTPQNLPCPPFKSAIYYIMLYLFLIFNYY